MQQCHYAEIGTQYLVSTDATWSECLASCCARQAQRATQYHRTWYICMQRRPAGPVSCSRYIYCKAYRAVARARSRAAPERAVGLYLQPRLIFSSTPLLVCTGAVAVRDGYRKVRGGTTTSRASEINKFMSLLSMALPIENLSIITFDSWLSRGRG